MMGPGIKGYKWELHLLLLCPIIHVQKVCFLFRARWFVGFSPGGYNSDSTKLKDDTLLPLWAFYATEPKK